jgi:hypothetical protein
MRHVGTDDPLKRWAMRIAKTRGKKIAAVALARKLAGVLWAMWRDGTVYDAGFGARESAKALRRPECRSWIRDGFRKRSVRVTSLTRRIRSRAGEATKALPTGKRPPQFTETANADPN